ncbi:MAG TPA: hypothetical protein VKE97_10020 [Acidimicrobiia bacterium]|nr:hypothetical protein [Acidimicrobiia bacterium]
MDDRGRDQSEGDDQRIPDDAADDDEARTSEGRPVDRFRRSATGAVVAAGLLGLRDALEGRPDKEEVAIVNEAPDAPPRDVDVVIDFDHPERSVALVRRRHDDNDSNEG